MSALSEGEHWLLSFYRSSEISGALFFGRLAGSMRPGPVQADMTKHFADESQHAWLWTRCLDELGAPALKLRSSYQDQYLSAAGLPANLMEVLALTQTFERRVVAQYSLHRRLPGLAEPVQAALDRILEDERWHIEWVGQALEAMKPEYGPGEVEKTLRRFQDADREVYEETVREHAERIDRLVRLKR